MKILTLVQLGFWLSSHQNLSYSNCPYVLGHSFRNQGFLGSMWLSKSGLHVFGLIAEGLGEELSSFKVWSGKWNSKPFLCSQTSNEMEASGTFGVEDLCVLAKPTSSTSSPNELSHVPRLCWTEWPAIPYPCFVASDLVTLPHHHFIFCTEAPFS